MKGSVTVIPVIFGTLGRIPKNILKNWLAGDLWKDQEIFHVLQNYRTKTSQMSSV